MTNEMEKAVEGFGLRLFEARCLAGLTQNSLARRAGYCSGEVIEEYENGSQYPCGVEALKLATILRCDPVTLMTGKRKSMETTENEKVNVLEPHVLCSMHDLAGKIARNIKILFGLKQKKAPSNYDLKLVKQAEDQIDFQVRHLTLLWNDLKQSNTH